MDIAHHRAAVLVKSFWFRKNIFSHSPSLSKEFNSSIKEDTPDKISAETSSYHVEQDTDEYIKMTINEIINGEKNVKNGFPGLIPLIRKYLDSIDVSDKIRQMIDKYLELIEKRATGEWQTVASWIRSFVRNHPDYRKDSIITQEINYDMIKEAERISNDIHKDRDLTNRFFGIS